MPLSLPLKALSPSSRLRRRPPRRRAARSRAARTAARRASRRRGSGAPAGVTTAVCASMPETSKQTMPAETAGSRGVIRRTFGSAASPSLSRVASCLDARWRVGVVASKACASAQRCSKECQPPGVKRGPGSSEKCKARDRRRGSRSHARVQISPVPRGPPSHLCVPAISTSPATRGSVDAERVHAVDDDQRLDVAELVQRQLDAGAGVHPGHRDDLRARRDRVRAGGPSSRPASPARGRRRARPCAPSRR